MQALLSIDFLPSARQHYTYAASAALWQQSVALLAPAGRQAGRDKRKEC